MAKKRKKSKRRGCGKGREPGLYLVATGDPIAELGACAARCQKPAIDIARRVLTDTDAVKATVYQLLPVLELEKASKPVVETKRVRSSVRTG